MRARAPSAVRRRPPWPALAAAWALGFGALSAYWAAGGTVGAHTVARALSERALARDRSFVATLWIAAVLKAALALLAVALARPARLARPVRVAGWITGIALVVYGALGLADFGSMALGLRDVPTDVGEDAVLWYVFLWEPLWVLGGLLFIAAARAARR